MRIAPRLTIYQETFRLSPRFPTFSSDGKVLALEEVGQRVPGLLFMAADTNSARAGTSPVC